MSPTLEITDLKSYIRDIPDFPKPGIIFKDITTLLKNKEALRSAIDLLVEPFVNQHIEQVVSVEARGFIFGSAVAYKLGAGLVPVRKKGKLPAETKSVSYQLEYGTDTLEIHKDAIQPKTRVLVVDDVLATGGTVLAVTKLLQGFNAEIVGISFLVELTFLKGKDQLKEFPIYSLIRY